MTTSVQDAIEREVFIRASIDPVWSLVSKAGFWVGDDLHFDIDARAGDLVVVETEAYGHFQVRVEELTPPRYAAYRWASAFPSLPLSDANSTLVEFTLLEREHGVLLKLRESGFANVIATHPAMASMVDANTTGWDRQLPLLVGATGEMTIS